MVTTDRSRRARFAFVTDQSDHSPDPKADFARYSPNANASRTQLQRSLRHSCWMKPQTQLFLDVETLSVPRVTTLFVTRST